ncbi:ATP-binding protein [candidate division KSB1 bacterium]|nr:ATP-binding protein [candidate division KSB1 bacterium]
MYKPRDIVNQASRYLASDYIMIFTGARQAGKTTILKYLFEKLKSEHQKVYFINLEDMDYLSLLNESPKNLFTIVGMDLKEKVTVFIDEIQYLKHPTNFLKYFFDEYRDQIKLIVSGSSAFYLDTKFEDSLAGRKRIFQVYPLSFSEFLAFKDEADLWEKFKKNVSLEHFGLHHFNKIEQRQLHLWIDEYLRFGGYPRVVLESDHQEKQEILRDLTDSFIKKDILEANVGYPDKFLQLLRLLASQIGGLVNKNELANTLGISTSAIDNYLTTMLKSFHLALIPPYYANLRKELTKQQKVYYYDLGLRNFLVRNFEIIDLRSDKGEVFENFIFRELLEFATLDQIKFWRTQNKNEVDFIVADAYAFEVKYQLATFSLSKYQLFRQAYDKIRFQVIYHTGTAGKGDSAIGFMPF